MPLDFSLARDDLIRLASGLYLPIYSVMIILMKLSLLFRSLADSIFSYFFVFGRSSGFCHDLFVLSPLLGSL